MKIKLLALGAMFASLCASVQGQAPVDKTPKLHLSFDSVSGSTVLNTGFGGSALNGTLNGGATIVPGGKFGNCLQVTGTASSDASCRIANAVVPLNVSPGSAWTVAMWIKSTTPGGTWAYQGDGGWNDRNTTFAMVVNNGSTGNSGTTAGGVRYGQGWQVGTATINDDVWHHVVFTFDGTTKVQYVDGVVDAWSTDGWAVSSADTGLGGQFYIGGSGTGEGDGQVCLNGLIDEAYVFDRALSQADVTQLYNSNTYPTVPVAVTVNPVSGYRGQVVSVTATATPTSGTVTNAKLNLSAFGLSSAINMGQSSANVFTNTFTVPATAPVGGALAAVTVISTEPLVGSGGATFTVVAKPPTNAIVVTQLTNTTAYQYTEVNFRFATTNDAPNDAPFPMAYSWYKNGTLVSTNAMGPNYTFLTVPGDNGAQIYAIARVADTNFSSISVTSAVVTLTVNSGTTEYAGLKQEFFPRSTRINAEIGNVGPGIISVSTNADSAGGFGDNHARRYSGYFTPPSDGSYVFFVASDDDCDVFLSTDNTPANKRLIAQEGGWSGTRNWQTAGGGGSVASQKRSDQWTNNVGEMPYSAGIPLTGGQKYYFEAVMHNGGGGDNWGVTYEMIAELALDPSQPLDGSASRMTVASNNIAFATWPGTAINWSTQPRSSITVNEGQSTNITAIAISDAEFTPKYQWFLVANGGALPGTALTGKIVNGTNLTMSLIPANYNNAQVYCIASTEFGGLSVTSSVATLHVIQSVFEPGWVSEKKWMDVFNITGVENGTLGDPTLTGIRAGFQAGLDNPGSLNRDNTIQQIGYFVAPSSGNYVFFITSHDGGDLFLSTDNTAANKRLVAQEAGWSGNFAWNQAGGGGSVISQKRSDSYSPDGGTTMPYSAGIPLVAGQRYYMEVDHTTSRWGNEQFGVTYRVMSGGAVTAPNDGDLPNVNGTVVGMNAVRCSYVNFTQQPSNITAAPMGYATFSVSGVTDSQYPPISSYGVVTTQSTNSLFYQWYKNGVAIPNATAKTLTVGPLLPSDNGATFYCAMRALGFANDSLTPIWTNSTSATLTISPQPVLENGVARVDWWSNTTSRVSVENAGAGSPTFSFVAPKFESPTANAPWNDYVNRVSGYFVAPSNGIYIFYISSDDDSDLFISTDANPANKKLVAQQTTWNNPFVWGTAGNNASQRRSDSFSPDNNVTLPGNPGYVGGLPMVAGQKYWMEAVHHNGSGGNNFEATFREYADYNELVDGTDSRLAENLIASYVPRIPWVAFLQQPVSQSATSGGNSVTFTARGTNPPSVWVGTTGNPALWLTNPPTSSVRYQWYKNGSAIPGATGSSYTLPYVLPSDQGAQFVCAMRALGYADDSLNPIYSNSVPAVLTVVTDTVPPTLSYAVTFQNTNQVPPQFIIDVTFSEWMDPTTLSNVLRYSISGVNITNISVASNHRTVQLLVDAMPTLPLSVTVNGVKDLSGNSIVGTPSVAINTDKLTFSDVGTPGTDPAYPSYVWVTSSNGYIVSAEGSDIWNAVDGFNFGWEFKTNDFDMVVRGVSITPTSQWAKQGLMVREDLSPGSREWSIQNEPLAADGGANRIDTSMRSTNSLASVNWSIAGTLPPPSYPNAWLRLKRTGSFLDGYYSTNGVDWVHATSYNTATNDVPLGSVVYFGICTTAHNNDVAGITPPTPFLYYNTTEYANYGPYVPAPNKAVLTASRSGANLLISWTPAGGHLEASPAISGPSVNWQTVSSSNPATVPIGTGTQFFRVVNP